MKTINRRWITVGLIATAFLLALLLRSAFSHGLVFRNDGVHYQEVDGYFHMRTVRNLMHHFPHRSGFDPYSGMPTGQPVTTGPFYDLAIGSTAWLIGVGSPSSSQIDIVGAWFPAVMGALITIPVYFIGSALFHPAAGLIAAFLIAILPGQFLKVSRLGFTDHHVAESFLATLALMFLVLALLGRSPKLNTLLAGLALGCFLVNRPIGAFLIGVIALWAVIQIFWDHLSFTSNQVWLIVAPAIAIAWLIFLPVGPIMWSEFTFLALAAGLAAVVVTGFLSKLLPGRVAFVSAIVGTAIATAALMLVWKPELLASLWQNIASRQGDGPASTVMELRPLLTKNGMPSWSPFWSEFTTTWFFALPALGLLCWRTISPLNRNSNRPAMSLFLAWSSCMLVLSLAQNRNCYFLSVNMALLTGWACRELVRLGRSYERAAISIFLLLVLIFPNVSQAIQDVSKDGSPDADWLATLAWLRQNTPEPFDDPGAFDRYTPPLPPPASFPYPPSAYGIMVWWDYGHWISAEARRIPVSNGMQTSAESAARFFTTANPEEAALVMLNTRSRYVVADANMVIPTAKDLNWRSGTILPMMIWLGTEPRDLSDVYLAQKPDGSTEPVMVFYPRYYESMLSRLYLFDAQAVTPDDSTWIIGYSEGPLKQGRRTRSITSVTPFKTYERAVAYLDKVRGEPFVLAGLSPIRSCVPLKKLDDYRLAFTTQPGKFSEASGSIHAVKVFEYRNSPK